MAQISRRGSKGHHTFTLVLTEGSYSIEDNTSPVNYTFTLVDDNDWYWSGWTSSSATVSYTITINGTNITGTIPTHNRSTGGKTQQVRTGSQTITHDDDGSKTISYSFSVTDTTGRSYTCGSASANSTMTLATIPRASSMSISPASPKTIDTITFNVTRASTSFTHTVTTAYNGSPYTLGTANFGTSTSITGIPTGIRSAMKSNNVSSVSLPLTLTTYNGNTVIGTKDYNMTISVPIATVTLSASSVACNTNITYTLGSVDTTACTYTVKRYDSNNNLVYTDQTKATTTSKRVGNLDFESIYTASPSGSVDIIVTTYVGSTSVAGTRNSYTVTIPTGTYKPTLTVASQLSRVNKVSYTYLTGITYLAGYDGATGTMTEGKANSSHAAITSRVVTVSGNKATWAVTTSGSTATINLGTFAASNTDYTVTVTYTVTDARGGTASLSFNDITVRGYSKPTFSNYLVQRANSSGTPANEGTYANITASASAHTIKNTSNTELNSMTSISYKLGTSGTEQTSGASVSGLNGTINKTAYGGSYAITNAYTFTITATDAIGSKTTVSYTLPKAVIALSLHKNTGVGLGTVAEAGYIVPGLPVKGPVNVRGDVVAGPGGTGMARGNVWSGSTTRSTTMPAQVGVRTSSGGQLFLASGGEGYSSTPVRLTSVVNNTTKNIISVDASNNATFNGNATSATSATTASKLGSSTVGGSSRPIYLNSGTATQVNIPESGSWWKGIPSVGTDGVMEIGKYIDFHNTNTTTTDNDGRIETDGTRLISSKEFRAPSFTKEYYGTYYPRRWCQGTSTTANGSATAGTFYYVPLQNTTAENPVINSSSTKLFGKQNGGIKVFRAGKYRVSASIYIGTGSGGRAGAYIYDSNNRAFSTSTSTELIGNALYGNGTDVVVTIPPKIITMEANHIVHLVARTMVAAGTIYYSNKSTYLLVEWVSD